ncbi:MAG: hypothetical protein MPN21_11520 [Thermoanaerobaculia bacterium]|nr:hypothetical protein [Thermoanaerobaculia bacterium]
MIGPEAATNLTPSAVGDPTDSSFRAAVLKIENGTSNPALEIGSGVHVKNLQFWYPDQGETDDPAVLKNEPTIEVDTSVSQKLIVIDNCVFVNSYDAIRIGDTGIESSSTPGLGPVWITDNYIYGINIGVVVGNTTAPIFILSNNFTRALFVPIGDEDPVGDYTGDNGEAIRIEGPTSVDDADEISRSPGIKIEANTIFGYRRGIRIHSGYMNLGLISNNVFDSVEEGIKTSGDFGGIAALTITGNSFRPKRDGNLSTVATPRGRALFLNGGQAHRFEFSGNYINLASRASIEIKTSPSATYPSSERNFMSISNNYFSGNPSEGHLLLDDDDTDLVFEGNTLLKSGNGNYTAIQIENARDVDLVSNTFSEFYQVLDVPSGASVSNLSLRSNLSRRSTASDACVITGTVSGTTFESGNSWDGSSGC